MGGRPRAVLKTEGTVFPNTDRPRPANNVFIFFLPKSTLKAVFVLNFHCSQPGVRVRFTSKKQEIYVTFFCISLFPIGHYLHFTFFVVKRKSWERRESWKISSGPYAGSGLENLDRWSARN